MFAHSTFRRHGQTTVPVQDNPTDTNLRGMTGRSWLDIYLCILDLD